MNRSYGKMERTELNIGVSNIESEIRDDSVFISWDKLNEVQNSSILSGYTVEVSIFIHFKPNFKQNI